MKASIDSIETLGLVDGPGIRCVIFFNGCKLRCKYCHNPEMWQLKDKNYTVDKLVTKILRCKPYFGKDGGVTFSGGEPLLQSDFIIEVAKKLKNENIHLALDTAGVVNSNYSEILSYMDLIILDIKHTNVLGYSSLTGGDINYTEEFIKQLNKSNKPVWIRQVIIPQITDTKEYLNSLKIYIQKINNIKKIEFLPYHKLGQEKYKALNIPYPYKDIPEMSEQKCSILYNDFINNI